jgi:cell division protein FtsB
MAHSPEQGLKLQLLAAALIAALVFLHYLLWIDEDGVRQTHTLRISIRAQTEENAELTERNRALAAEIEDLKRGLMAIEERARADMGMVRPDETFYRLLDKPLSPAATPNKPTPSAKSAPSAKPPVSAAPLPTPAVKPAPTDKPPAPAAKPASPAKPPVPAAKPASPAKPPAPVAKPAAP